MAPTAMAAQVPAGMPADVPAAASDAPPTLPEPSTTAWPFPNAFPQTSGTGRLDGGVGISGGFSYWRVDWVTLADPNVPIAEWTFDTDNNAATGASAWPAGAGVTLPGIERALVVSSRGAWLVDPTTGTRTDVVANGGRLTVDRTSKSFIVAVPNSLLPVSGTWRVRLGAGLADPTGQSFAAPDVATTGSSALSLTAERLYNVTFRSVGQEPPVYTDGMTDALVALAQAATASDPVGAALGADGEERQITGNFWMEDDQADTLAGGNVSKFSQTIDWSALAAHDSTPEPQPTGYSARWYVSRLHPGSGQVIDDGAEGNFKPTLLEQVQPYSVCVPTTYRQGQKLPLTWILHSLEVNYNQYGGYDPQLIQQLCQQRDSICATTEGFGPAGWDYDEAETDFWQVWRSLADSYSLDPERTVISGYSMGGWASYKLAFEHPDDFAGSLVLDGPVAPAPTACWPPVPCRTEPLVPGGRDGQPRRPQGPPRRHSGDRDRRRAAHPQSASRAPVLPQLRLDRGGSAEREANAGQLLGDVPQAPGDTAVLGGLAASDELGGPALLHEPAGPGEAVAGNVGHRRIQGRQRAAVLVLGDQAVAKRADDLEQPVLAVKLEVGCRVTRVSGVGQDARAGGRQPALKLGGEQQVGELGLPVGAPRLVGLALPVEVVEVDRAHAVACRGDRHDASGHMLEHQVGEREVAEVVGAELQLKAVGGPRQRRDHHAGVVDQQIDLALPALSERPHGGQVTEIQGTELNGSGHASGRAGALLGVAAGEDDARPVLGESRCGGAADAAVGPGDDRGATALIGNVVGAPSGSSHGQQCRW
jgi:pimeloyl-ACP methyl ester carboxylesterase